MPGYEKMPEISVHFEDTYIRSRRRLGRSNVIVLPTFQKKDGIISKPRLKVLVHLNSKFIKILSIHVAGVKTFI